MFHSPLQRTYEQTRAQHHNRCKNSSEFQCFHCCARDKFIELKPMIILKSQKISNKKIQVQIIAHVKHEEKRSQKVSVYHSSNAFALIMDAPSVHPPDCESAYSDPPTIPFSILFGLIAPSFRCPFL